MNPLHPSAAMPGIADVARTQMLSNWPLLCCDATVDVLAHAGRPSIRVRDIMRTKRVLIADDHEDGALSLLHLIAAWGHHVEAVFNGSEAVELARRFRPDVVILDINMPVMDGYVAAGLLRGEHERVLLIAMTGSPARETREKARDAGFHHHFQKPIEPAELAKLLSLDEMDHLSPGFRMSD